VAGGNAVAPKRVEFTYEEDDSFDTITRYADLAGTQLVASSDYTHDAGRLTELVHSQDVTELATYVWDYDEAGRIDQFIVAAHRERSAPVAASHGIVGLVDDALLANEA